MPFVRSDNADIYWKMEGRAAAPPLVLLNSIGVDMDLWDAALERLRRHFLLLRIDTRGHGASSAPVGDYTLEQLAGDVASAMDAAGIARSAIVGVSLGGMIAMQFALSAPERVAALGLVCTSARMDSAAWQARVERVQSEGVAGIADLAMGRFLSPKFVASRPEIAETVRRGLLATPAAGYAGCAAAIRDMAIAERLSQIRCAALVITGAYDVSTPYEGHGDFLLSALADARHVVLDAAHLAPLEASEPLAGVLIDFFNGAARG